MNRRSIHDEHRLLPRYRSGAHHAEVGKHPASRVRPREAGASYGPDAADAWALRGIPAIVDDGLGGVIPGTQPEAELLRNHPDWGSADL